MALPAPWICNSDLMSHIVKKGLVTRVLAGVQRISYFDTTDSIFHLSPRCCCPTEGGMEKGKGSENRMSTSPHFAPGSDTTVRSSEVPSPSLHT